MNEKTMQLINVRKVSNDYSLYDLLYGFAFIEPAESSMVSRRIITVIPRKWRKDKVIVEDVVFLEFNE